MLPGKLDYASPAPRRTRRRSTWRDRRPTTPFDQLYFALVVGCYLLYAYAACTMPGYLNFSSDLALAQFLLTVAALSGVTLALVGLREIIWRGPKRCNFVILCGAILAGALPPFMALCCPGWLASNFA